MAQLLKDLGFTDVTHKKTAGRGANVDLIDATVEILEMVADDTPVLILEDDVQWTGHGFAQAQNDVNVNVNVNVKRIIPIVQHYRNDLIIYGESVK